MIYANGREKLSINRILIVVSLPWLVGITVSASGEDVVHYRHPRHDRRVRATGQIVNYTDQQLRLRTVTGRETAIPSERILTIQSAWTPEHVSADQRFGQRRFDDALGRYRLAYGKEKRAWVRQRILAQIVWCYQSLGELERAGGFFVQMVRAVPNTPYLDCLPLVWHTFQPSPRIERQANSWLQTESSPAVALLAASWLLSGRDRVTARQTLQQLRTGQNSSIATLAQAQLWRTQIATATAQDLAQWQSTIDGLPHALRAGPFYVLGKTMVYHDQFEAAVLALLRVPILYSRHRLLAAEALVSAGQLLERMPQNGPARRLYLEVVDEYADTTAADLARQRLVQLSKTGSD